VCVVVVVCVCVSLVRNAGSPSDIGERVTVAGLVNDGLVLLRLVDFSRGALRVPAGHVAVEFLAFLAKIAPALSNHLGEAVSVCV